MKGKLNSNVFPFLDKENNNKVGKLHFFLQTCNKVDLKRFSFSLSFISLLGKWENEKFGRRG